MDTKQLLLELSAMTGIPGRETDAVSYAAEKLAGFGDVSITPLGSAICSARPCSQGSPHILLDAHIDEIGMVVTHIDDAGFLRVGACGGIDRRILAASPVTVHTASGAVDGVVCSTPPHLASADEQKNQKIEEICIDIGLSGEAAKEAVSPGDAVTLVSTPMELAEGLVCGKALDDRAGCVALLKTLELLDGVSLSCGLTVQFSTMEEVGGQGAKTAAYTVNPTHAIAVDVSFAHTPDSAREKCGELKKGPMIGISPILNKAMSDELIALAKASEIPFQHEVMGGRTGTNADSIATTRGGVTTGLVSIPQKYMHTPIEVVAVSDVDNTARLIAEYIKSNWEVS